MRPCDARPVNVLMICQVKHTPEQHEEITKSVLRGSTLLLLLLSEVMLVGDGSSYVMESGTRQKEAIRGKLPWFGRLPIDSLLLRVPRFVGLKFPRTKNRRPSLTRFQRLIVMELRAAGSAESRVCVLSLKHWRICRSTFLLKNY